MHQTLHCSQCGKKNIDFETISVEVQLRYHGAPCEACRRSHTDRLWVIFCSPECLVRYAMEKGFSDEVARLEERSRQ
jgi:hypothetical protein